jgi:hypothetical protein
MRFVEQARAAAVEELFEEEGVNPLRKGRPITIFYLQPSARKNVGELLFYVARLAMEKRYGKLPEDARAFCQVSAITDRKKVKFHQGKFNCHPDVTDIVIMQLRGELRVTTITETGEQQDFELKEGEMAIVPAKTWLQFQRPNFNGNAVAVAGFVREGDEDPYGRLPERKPKELAEPLVKGHSVLAELEEGDVDMRQAEP